jgi:hypothetical protein
MKILSKTRALERLKQLKNEFAESIRAGYEYRAKSCAACETPGACCLDAHFVNVRITKLEAEAIAQVIDRLPAIRREGVQARIEDAVSRYGLVNEDAGGTYACPLHDSSAGCLVHETAKPLPCIQHACYENKADLPPDQLLADAEAAVERLNTLTYGRATAIAPLPVMINE